MADYKNWDELRRGLEKKVDKALKSDVKDYVERQISERIYYDVYEAYSPIRYERTEGLYSQKNFYHYTYGDFEMSGYYMNDEDPHMYLSVGHDATNRSGQSLSKLIILGQEGAKSYGDGVALYREKYVAMRKRLYDKYGNPNNETPFYEPRDFIGNAKMVISSERNELIGAFRRGMK